MEIKKEAKTEKKYMININESELNKLHNCLYKLSWDGNEYKMLAKFYSLIKSEVTYY